jgi:serine/threonine-protein kinase
VPKSPLIKQLPQFISMAGITLIVWALLTLILDKVAMPLITHQGSEVEIPNLLQIPFEKAKMLAEDGDFKLQIMETRYDSITAPGLILQQSPLPGAIAKTGKTIQVIVSEGKQMVTMPGLIGLPLKEAVIKLEANMLKFSEPRLQKAFSDDFPEGVVIGQPYSAGSRLKKGSAMGLTISLGPPPKYVTVPILYALELKKAGDLVSNSGLTLGKIEYITHPQADSGLVVEQYPLPDSKVNYLTAVNLKISRGRKY